MTSKTSTAAAETTTGFLWINENGMTVCAEHGGSYLTAAIAARPTAKKHTTPLDSWERFTAAEAAEYGLACETCARRS